ncbi:hypothetical protein SKAU_G00115890, partial [Synaphobranchus kaupii]
MGDMDWGGLPSFYRSLLQVWKVFSINRQDVEMGPWIMDEPLFFNQFLPIETLRSGSVRAGLLRAGITRVCHLRAEGRWLRAEQVAETVKYRSVRVCQKILDELTTALPASAAAHMERYESRCPELGGGPFPEVTVAAELGDWQEREELILSFRTPQMGVFSGIEKKALYIICVKVLNLRALEDIRISKWTDLLGPDSSPKGSWRVLYKVPIDKKSGDLQWRIVHGALATNRHKAHLDPTVGEGCAFCGASETVFHAFIQCARLEGVLHIVRKWCMVLGGGYSHAVFIYGPKYSIPRKREVVLLNFLLGKAKAAIWMTRHRIGGTGSVETLHVLRCLIRKRLLTEL